MRILLVNKFYYPRGGDCIYTINLESLLKKHGHETAIFAMDYHRNIETPWKKYFPSEVRFRMGPKIIDSMLRPFGTKEVKEKYNAILDEFHPDVVHLNNIHSQLSPIVAELAHQRGIKVVWTLHDYKLLCPRYDCMRNDGASCDDCFANHNFSEKKQKRNVLKNKCMKNSYLASYIAYKEALTWNRERLENNTDAYICPSHFMAA
ncbi:MAG: glycosyltransferase, partial [Prevotella sp.]|nr:glycosyltransferase [Prevotella sp.]